MKIFKPLLYSLLVCFTFCSAQNPDANTPTFIKRSTFLSDNQKTDGMDLFVDSILKKYMQNSERCGISIGISKNGKDYFYNYGETKRGSENIPKQTSIYEIGALTTIFCGQLLEQAIRDNKIKAEDDIRNYLPGKFLNLEFNKKPILVKHLVQHTSGLPLVPADLKEETDFDALNPYAHYTKKMLLNYLKTFELTRSSGSMNDYSNTGIALLGIVLEGVYDKTFSELVNENICIPLGLKNTWIDLNTEQTQNLSSGYNIDGEATPAWTFDVFAAAGGLKSCTEDVLNYLKFNLEEIKNSVKNSGAKTKVGKENLGMAWYVSKTKNGTILYSQSGGTFGYGAFSGFIAKEDCAVILLSNNGINLEFLGIAILNYLQQ
ncbi:serine hydrolase domain-containing protein [Aurantibacillus circumpalustris]|uniref:serine hydrolase domain-containing protein n=1 Tax=Aurantibacillus circumpalustris TaxID=3036359 RepID=UPI00295ABCDD|nr:serine hydrolase [Aurantibacillus circumpalustris]